jgi:peptide-methionine (S)-S-oxide reductase
MSLRIATFAAGCFWCVEAVFQKVEGVLGTRVGYCGGNLPDPTYEQVKRGATGHAEACEVSYDPSVISFEELLAVFWECHDPTSVERQGPDVGPQYRSAVFCHDQFQFLAAHQSRAALEVSHHWPAPIVTEVVLLRTFWPAEEEHQQYLAKQGLPGCANHAPPEDPGGAFSFSPTGS